MGALLCYIYITARRAVQHAGTQPWCKSMSGGDEGRGIKLIGLYTRYKFKAHVRLIISIFDSVPYRPLPPPPPSTPAIREFHLYNSLETHAEKIHKERNTWDGQQQQTTRQHFIFARQLTNSTLEMGFVFSLSRKISYYNIPGRYSIPYYSIIWIVLNVFFDLFLARQTCIGRF